MPGLERKEQLAQLKKERINIIAWAVGVDTLYLAGYGALLLQSPEILNVTCCLAFIPIMVTLGCAAELGLTQGKINSLK